MIPIEWYRVFVAIYREGSVSRAAEARCTTQPAVSQTLASLEKAVGVPLFERSSRGVKPTPRGEALYAQVFDAVDRLERVGRSMAGRNEPLPTFRFGASPEVFHEFVLPRIASLGIPLAVKLDGERELLSAVETGAIDAALTTLRPTGRTLQHTILGERRYVLIAPPGTPRVGIGDLAAELNSLPWVSYSEERPTTRRYFSQVLKGRFEAKTPLVVPDLRSVVRAVELGVGISIVPDFACERALAEGRLVELFSLDISSDHWALTYRELDADRPELQTILAALSTAQR